MGRAGKSEMSVEALVRLAVLGGGIPRRDIFIFTRHGYVVWRAGTGEVATLEED